MTDVEKAMMILDKIGEDLENGRLNEARELLHQAYELISNDDLALYSRCSELAMLLEIQEILKACEYRKDDNPVAAWKTLQQGLRYLINEDSLLPVESRELLKEISDLALDAYELRREEIWRAAKNLATEFHASLDNRVLARKTQHLIELWIDLGRDIALTGAISSSVAMGDLSEAYHLASTYLKSHPRDKEAVDQVVSLREDLLAHLNNSATKRLGRAETALEEGEVEFALDILEEIETSLYGPIEERFPGFLTGVTEIDEVRLKAEKLRQRALFLEQVREDLKWLLKNAEDLFKQEEFSRAESILHRILSDKRIESITKRAKELLQHIRASRREDFDQAMIVARQAMEVSTNELECIKEMRQKIERLDARANFETLVQEKSKVFYQLLRSLYSRERIAEIRREANSYIEYGEYRYAYDILKGARGLAQVSQDISELEMDLRKVQKKRIAEQRKRLREDAEIAIEDRRYRTAYNIFHHLYELTEDQHERAALETRMRAMKERDAYQEKYEEILRQALSMFSRQNYREAVASLSQAAEMAREVSAPREEELRIMLKAAQAGEDLEQARLLWQEGTWEETESKITLALKLAQNNPHADRILEEAEDLQAVIKRQRRIHNQLVEVQSELSKGNLEKATQKVESVLEEALPRGRLYTDAVRLQAEIHQVRQAKDLLGRIEAAINEDDYEKANSLMVAFKGSGLPDSTEAQTLLKQIKDGLERQRQEAAERTIETLLEKAESSFRNRLFESAKSFLEAAHSESEHLADDSKISSVVEIKVLLRKVETTDEVWGRYGMCQ